MPLYDLPCCLRSIARLALCAVIALAAVVGTDLAGGLHWTLAVLTFAAGVGGILLVGDTDHPI